MGTPNNNNNNNNNSNGNGDDNSQNGGIFSWLMSKVGLGGGIGDIFSSIFSFVFYGVILAGIVWALNKWKDPIGNWLNDVTGDWKLGDKFKDGMSWVSNKLGGLVGKFAPSYVNDAAFKGSEAEIKERFIGQQVAEPMADVIAKNAPAIKKVLDDNKIAVNLAFTKDTLPQTLPAFVKGLDPNILKQMIAAAMQPAPPPPPAADGKTNTPATGMSQQAKDMMSVILTSKADGMDDVRNQIPALLQGVQVSDPATKAMLQYAGNKDILQAAATFANADGVGEANFTQFMTALTTKGANGKPDFNSDDMKAVIEAVKDPKYKAALQTFAKTVGPNLSDPEAKDFMAALANDPTSAFTLAKAMAPAAPPPAVPAGTPDGHKLAAPLLAAKPTAPPAPNNMPSSIDDLIETKPELLDAYSKQISLLGNHALQEAQHTQDAAVKLMAIHDGSGHYPNLSAVVEFSKSVASSNTGAARARAHHVIDGLLAMVMPNPHAPKLNADEVSEFFKQQANVNAFGKLLHDLDVKSLPADKQAIVAALKDNWNNGDGHSIAAVLADKAGAQKFVGGDGKGLDPTAKHDLITNGDGWIKAWNAKEHLLGHPGLPDSIMNNLPAVKAVAAVSK